MKFTTALRISQLMNMFTIIGLFTFVYLRPRVPTAAWVVFGVMILLGVAAFPINWKYLRCPKCNHVLPVQQMRRMACPLCGARMRVDEEGNLQLVEDDKQ